MQKHELELAGYPLGCSLVPDFGAVFKVWAPNAAFVSVVGEFNDWDEEHTALERCGDEWWGCVKGVKAGDEYQYRVRTPSGDTLSRNDPRARLLTNSAGNSVAYDADLFDWQGDGFVIENWNALVIYELHIGTFCGEKNKPGNFDLAIKKLPYLQELGINAIELMPVAEFPGDYSWGYNPAYPFAVEESYGGPDALKRFIKAAHEHGIAVILDVVYNHFGPSDLHLWQFDGWSENGKGGIYFYNDWRSSTPWGDTRPDYGRAEVRQYIYDNALMWINEFHVDGLRLDMVPYLRSVDGSESPESMISEGYDLIRWINDGVAAANEKALMIAEDLHGNDFITNDTHSGGCGYGAQWDADFVHPIRAFLQEPDDVNRNIEVVEWALKRRYSRGIYHRIVYTESHDETANGRARVPEELSNGDVDNDTFAKRRSMQGIALTLTAPGIPMLFYGQELLEYKWFDDTHNLHWERQEQFPEFNRIVSELITLKKSQGTAQSGLSGDGLETLHFDNENKVLAYARFGLDLDSDGVICLFNFSYQDLNDYSFTFGTARRDWRVYIAASDEYLARDTFRFYENEDASMRVVASLSGYSFAILVHD